MPRQLTILGSTGSIGCSTLEVVRRFPDRWGVKALTAGRNIERLVEQVKQFRPELVVVLDDDGAKTLRERLSGTGRVEIQTGESGIRAAASMDGVDMVVSAVVGAAGLLPTLAAIDAGKDIALANKESLVMAGHLVMRRVAERGGRLLPVDSEHSAIFQCLAGQRRQDVEKLLLTASGGPFRRLSRDRFAAVRPADALAHPTWQMGPKITVDSATLMNKGLEVIEARWLFDVSADRIEVVVHPQSIVHSMVAFRDGTVIAQMGVPDMKGAIAYALSCPERLALGEPVPDFAAIGALNFEKPDFSRFACLGLAFDACREGGTLPAVMNAANEVAVAAFLAEQISFASIAQVIAAVMEAHDGVSQPELEEILEADRWARRRAGEAVASAAHRFRAESK